MKTTEQKIRVIEMQAWSLMKAKRALVRSQRDMAAMHAYRLRKVEAALESLFVAEQDTGILERWESADCMTEEVYRIVSDPTAGLRP